MLGTKASQNLAQSVVVVFEKIPDILLYKKFHVSLWMTFKITVYDLIDCIIFPYFIFVSNR